MDAPVPRKLDTPRGDPIAARFVWLATFVFLLILAGLLLAVSAAPASPVGPVADPLALEEGFEAEEEGELEEAECETAEEELEEGEAGEVEPEQPCADKDGNRAAGSSANATVVPEECLLKSAHARVVGSGSRNSVRLTVGYTTYEPTAVTVDYRAKEGRGSLHLGTAHHQLGRSGVIRLTEELTDAEMAKVRAADRIVVRLHVAKAPGSCRHFETRQLTVKRTPGRQTVWSQPG